MLFTSALFVSLYLPLVLALFFGHGHWSPSRAATVLFGASLLFYGVWMPVYVLLLLGSIVGNFVLGRAIATARAEERRAAAKRWMVLGVCANLGLLAYYKYANFFIDNLNALTGQHWQLGTVLLPIGISFFSFTQIAFLADSYQKGVKELSFSHYGLFVTYFPHLIAGPVLHHAQIMPQFRDPAIYRWQGANFSAGLLIFVIGLFKKIVLADGVSPYADAIFSPVDAGAVPGLQEAWIGAVAYTLEIYFDFSGYSDMAIGLSRLFNVSLPFNFDSPYKATSIIDFWRRWHISLSTFLKDYLYIALGGNRHGSVRRYANVATTMILGGLWHGASWSFVLWGTLHGSYLMINHAFRAVCGKALQQLSAAWSWRVLAWALTMLSVIAAWVFFRATTLDGALRMLQALVPCSLTIGASDGIDRLLWTAGLPAARGWLLFGALSLAAVALPNSNAIGLHLVDLLQRRPSLRAAANGLALGAVALLVLLNTARDAVSAFIYFNF